MKSLISQVGEAQLVQDIDQIISQLSTPQHSISVKEAIWHYEIFMALLEE
jgi:hypothetical protein